jgi:hypothetical protein
MKNWIIAILFIEALAADLRAHGQDTLVLRDNRELYVKIIEIAEDKIFYRSSDNPSGPLYSCASRDVFMAIYHRGKREMFPSPAASREATSPNTNEPAPPTNSVMSEGDFRVELKKIDHADGKGKYETVTAEVDVYMGKTFFATVSFTASRKKTASIDFSHPRLGDVIKSGANMQISSPQLKDFLYEKYENPAGAGLGWVLPTAFFTGDPTGGCEIAYLQKPRQNEIDVTWLQGKLGSEKYQLKSCGSMEEKVLSIVLLWVKKNFKAGGVAAGFPFPPAINSIRP